MLRTVIIVTKSASHIWGLHHIEAAIKEKNGKINFEKELRSLKTYIFKIRYAVAELAVQMPV